MSELVPLEATQESTAEAKVCEVLSVETDSSLTSSESTCDESDSHSELSSSHITETTTTCAVHSTLLAEPVTTMIASPSIMAIPSNSQLELWPTIQNIVSTVDLSIKLKLRDIAMKCRNSEYNPKRLNALIMRIREPRTTALIFSSGKMVCTGAKSEHQARLSARKFARIIQKIGFEPQFLCFRIHNIVASCDLGFSIYLEALSIAHRKYCSYEAELFPGLIYRMVKPKIVLLVFVSGKVVLTGAKFKDEIFDGFNAILPVLKSFAKRDGL